MPGDELLDFGTNRLNQNGRTYQRKLRREWGDVFGSWLNYCMASPLTATRILFPTSHQVDCEKSVHSPRDNREGEKHPLAWESVDTRGEGIAGNSLASSESCAYARVSPCEPCAWEVSLNFIRNGGTSENIVIRSRITWSLNNLTWHRYDRKHIEEQLQVCNCCSSETFFSFCPAVLCLLKQ